MNLDEMIDAAAEESLEVCKAERSDSLRLASSDADTIALHIADAEPLVDRYRRWTVPELLAADLTYHWDAVGLQV